MRGAALAPSRIAPLARFAVLVPLGLAALAAILRLPNLATRGTWDADQGHDMLMLRGLVRDGVVPLLGPPTSIGDVHHGALYYYLLSPAAFVTGGDSPLAVTALIALAGIAAVVVTWWLARSIGGPVAGLVAGLAMAVSSAAVDESTFIWNPNLIALSSAIALAGAWRAWSTRQPRWWLLAAVGTAVTMQCHVLGVTMLPIVGALFVADVRGRGRGRGRPGGPDGGGARVWQFGLAGLAIIALSFVPLAIHELTTDFTEVNAALDYIRSGGDPATLGPLLRAVVIGVRVVSWPLAGLITQAAGVALIATLCAIVIVVGLARFGMERERQVARWLGLGLLWTVLALTFISPSLATVVPGLPNDHYHAFADPMVFVLVGVGAGALWRGVRGRGAVAGARSAGPGSVGGAVVGRGVVLVGLAGLLLWNLGHQPPTTHPDGGFPAAEQAAARILAATGGDAITLRSLPDFKSTEAYLYPLVRAGADAHADVERGPAAATRGALVVICDSLFEVAIGNPCGGAAESVIAPSDRFGQPIDRFVAAPGRTISIYRPVP